MKIAYTPGSGRWKCVPAPFRKKEEITVTLQPAREGPPRIIGPNGTSQPRRLAHPGLRSAGRHPRRNHALWTVA